MRSCVGRCCLAQCAQGTLPTLLALTSHVLARAAGKPFDAMNSIAATLLLHLTSSARFEGDLNVDLNDITMNMVPFPRQHFVLSSMSPLAVPRDQAKLAATRWVRGRGQGRGKPFLMPALQYAVRVQCMHCTSGNMVAA
jgi:hypothetical protein